MSSRHPTVLIITQAHLTLWIPRESIEVAKNEARNASPRFPVDLYPLAPAQGSEWQSVLLTGEANTILEIGERIEKLVEEVDDCVLAVNVAKVRQLRVRSGAAALYLRAALAPLP